MIEPLTEEEIADCESALAESPSVDGQRWYGVWSDLIERLLVTIRDQEAETQRLDEEISVLQEQTKASRESVAQFCRMLGVDTDVEAWDELASLLRLVNYMPEAPAYVVPPADPLLAKPEKNR